MDWIYYVLYAYLVIGGAFLGFLRSDPYLDNYVSYWKLWTLDVAFALFWPVTFAAFFYAYISGDLDDVD